MTRIIDWCFRLFKFIIVVCLALMAVLVFGIDSVVSRFPAWGLRR